MQKLKICFKNFTAGGKALIKRILLYCATAIAAFEIISLAIESDSFASVLSGIPYFEQYISPLLGNILVYIGIAVLAAVIMQFSFASYTREVEGLDTKISLKIGDIFDCDDGCIIIPSNNMFANDTDIIGRTSIQNQLSERIAAKRYKADVSIEEQIKSALDSEEFRNSKLSISPRTFGERSYEFYPYGKIVPLKLKRRGKDRHFYLLSMSEIKADSTPVVSKEELLASIDEMWNYIRSNRLANSTVVLPVMGTGAARMYDEPAQTIAKYLIKSFITNHRNLGIDHFILSIYPGDYLNNRIKIDELREYVDYVCKFPELDFNHDNL